MLKKAMLGIADGDEMWHCDVIEHEGSLWLVPEWLHHPTEGCMQPARIIRMTGQSYQENPAGSWLGDYLLNDPIPKAVLDGRIACGQGVAYAVVERPDIRIPTGG